MSMSDSSFTNGTSPLYTEHLMMGATFGPDGLVEHYAVDKSDASQGSVKTFLCDISHLTTLAMYEDVAQSFAETVFAGAKLNAGECAFEAVLTGDGSIASVPLLARTGMAEYVAFDFSPRSEVLEAWLDFVRGASQGGYAPYAELGMQEATGTHVVLALWGNMARQVLLDYAKLESLPKPGFIASCHLDKIPCIIASPRIQNSTFFFVLVPPASSVVLWRSFLSFVEVEPVGVPSFIKVLGRALPWFDSLNQTDALRIPAEDLAKWGLVRNELDFVGARGINSSKEGEPLQ